LGSKRSRAGSHHRHRARRWRRAHPAAPAYNPNSLIYQLLPAHTNEFTLERTRDELGEFTGAYKRGVAASARVWTDIRIDWSRFDAVVVRSTWDYHLQPERFWEWITLVSSQTKLVNADLLAWNMHKRYYNPGERSLIFFKGRFFPCRIETAAFARRRGRRTPRATY